MSILVELLKVYKRAEPPGICPVMVLLFYILAYHLDIPRGIARN